VSKKLVECVDKELEECRQKLVVYKQLDLLGLSLNIVLFGPVWFVFPINLFIVYY